MKKEILFLLIFVIGICLICGCVNQSHSSTPKSVATPIPTPQNHFNINEPATDGNLRVTVLGTREGGDRVGFNGDKKMYYVKVKLENLRSDKKIQVYPQDFTLFTKNGGDFSTMFFASYYSQSYDVSPNKYGSPELEYTVPLDAVGDKLKFDFSRPSGVLKGGKVVYFVL
jgi:hypothetical protein